MSRQHLPPGLYEALVTRGLDAKLESLGAHPFQVLTTALDPADSHEHLARHVAEELKRALKDIPERERTTRQLELVNALLEQIRREHHQAVPQDREVSSPGRLLQAVYRQQVPRRPLTPIAISELLTGAHDEPRLGTELMSELASADRVDLLVSFIKWRGWRQLAEGFQVFAQRGGRVRVLTTTYMGASDESAVEAFANLPGAEVRISYDTRCTRLHAKAWLFHRDSGFSTAYVGSANLSETALGHGLEWTLKACEPDAPHILEKFRGAFESLWQDKDFCPFAPGDQEQRARLHEALRQARYEVRGRHLKQAAVPEGNENEGQPIHPSGAQTYFTLRPYPFQQIILDRLEAERALGHLRNLVVAATGTGKTLIAAFDYARQVQKGIRPALLFVAHREELLIQARDTFRHVLRDEAFGQLLGAGWEPTEFTWLFATIQSLDRRNLVHALGEARWEVVIVDEFHHAEAPTYERLLHGLKPRILLGLTATPERADGRDVRHWFSERTAAEIRLWEALNRQLLTPFEYYGLHDGTDLRQVSWSRGGYEMSGLEKVYTGNHRRAELVIHQLRRLHEAPRQARALGFCVSVGHAQFMAEQFSRAGLPAIAVHGGSSDEERRSARQRLVRCEVNVIFTCDLYNEGVDIPEVDTLLFLRPTESATVFLQQLGRGLRRQDGKISTLVLDFIGTARREFRFDQRFVQLTGASRGRLREELQAGFPTLPSGCHLQLDHEAQSIVLKNLEQQLRGGLRRLAQELREVMTRLCSQHEAENAHPNAAESTATSPVPCSVSLGNFLRETGRPLEDVYTPRYGWTTVRREAGLLPAVLPDEHSRGMQAEELKRNRLFRQLLHLDDLSRLTLYRRLLAAAPEHRATMASQLEESDQRRMLMLASRLMGQEQIPASSRALLDYLSQFPSLCQELEELFAYQADQPGLPTATAAVADGSGDDGSLSMPQQWPLLIHRRYHRDEVLAAVGLSTFARRFPSREGRVWVAEANSELLFVTLNKSEQHFSPTTRYQDYAISSQHFHWQSQSGTSDTSPTGRRYVEQASHGCRFVLLVREHRQDAFTLLGPVAYVSHSGNRPMSITWRLAVPIPARLLARYATLLAA